VRTYAWGVYDDEEEMRPRGVPGQMAGRSEARRGDALGVMARTEETAEERRSP